MNEHKHFRGLHIVVINPINYKVIMSKVFDTYITSNELNRFAAINIPEGYIIAAGCKDDCLSKLSN